MDKVISASKVLNQFAFSGSSALSSFIVLSRIFLTRKSPQISTAAVTMELQLRRERESRVAPMHLPLSAEALVRSCSAKNCATLHWVVAPVGILSAESSQHNVVSAPGRDGWLLTFISLLKIIILPCQQQFIVLRLIWVLNLHSDNPDLSIIKLICGCLFIPTSLLPRMRLKVR